MSFSKKIVTISMLAIAIGIAFGGYYWWSQKSCNGICSYDEKKHLAQMTELFRQDHYWLSADPDLSHSIYLLKSRSPDVLLSTRGTMTIKVYQDDGKVHGFVTYYMEKPGLGRILFLEVGKDSRGKKYGETLMKYALEQLRKQGAKKVWLAVRAHNMPAQKLYYKLGFTEYRKPEEGFLFLAHTF